MDPFKGMEGQIFKKPKKNNSKIFIFNESI